MGAQLNIKSEEAYRMASRLAELGDCFAYALAKESGEPLLFNGSDLSHTDIEPALKD
ncbi:MAG: hypothetical protein AB7O80_11715 [Acetobacteraceae bacterium]